jgi:hypothetical protein
MKISQAKNTEEILKWSQPNERTIATTREFFIHKPPKNTQEAIKKLYQEKRTQFLSKGFPANSRITKPSSHNKQNTARIDNSAQKKPS